MSIYAVTSACLFLSAFIAWLYFRKRVAKAIAKTIWKMKYANYIHKRTQVGFRFGYEGATIQLEENMEEDEWLEEDPEYMAYEELCCWSD
jgi:hypothetical protein